MVPGETLAKVRHAILGCELMSFRYRRRDGREALHEGMEPHGVLFGGEAYLVAYRQGMPNPTLFRLGALREIDSGGMFERRADFDIKTYAARSFGVFQGEQLQVRLRFCAEVAEQVREFAFHPTQMLEELPGGEVRVHFVAAGEVEICQHLFTWGANVVVEGRRGCGRRLGGWLGNAS